VIPMFPELREPLNEVWELAPKGAEHIITKYRGENPRTGFLRILRRARVDPWPRLFHNLRASRETELADQFPEHVACYWAGNSKVIARKHYLQVTDEHYKSALQKALHSSATKGHIAGLAKRQETQKALENKGFGSECASCTSVQVAEEGLELSTNPPKNTRFSDSRAAKCAALGDDDLARLVDVWPELPEDIRKQIIDLMDDWT